MQRRGFLSAVVSSLASLPFVGKLFGGEKTNGNGIVAFGAYESIPYNGPTIKFRLWTPNSETIRWIPVTDRLPECTLPSWNIPDGKRSVTILTKNSSHVNPGYYCEYADGTESEWLTNEGCSPMRLAPITHWSEMPKGPRS